MGIPLFTKKEALQKLNYLHDNPLSNPLRHVRVPLTMAASRT